jgi:hypothetical protein
MVYRYLLFLLPLLSSKCVKNNPNPSWLEVTEWTLEANPELNGEEGQLTHKLTDAWVYIDDELIGVFEVPFKIPILKEGLSKIRLYPTIRVNGIAATKMRNEHLEAFEVQAELIQNQTLELNPVTHYKSNVSFWVEDFEDINIKLTDDPNTSSAHLNLANDTLKWFNGNYYGRVLLNAQDSMWIAYTNQDQQLSIPMNKSPLNMLRWKKIYILLSEVITAGPNNSNYIQAFKAFYDANISNNLILIDNIKVVYFE